jgi:hypothetical protein
MIRRFANSFEKIDGKQMMRYFLNHISILLSAFLQVNFKFFSFTLYKNPIGGNIQWRHFIITES